MKGTTNRYEAMTDAGLLSVLTGSACDFRRAVDPDSVEDARRRWHMLSVEAGRRGKLELCHQAQAEAKRLYPKIVRSD